MTHDPGTEDPGVARAARWAALGHAGPIPEATVPLVERAVRDDTDPRARVAALGALVRSGPDDVATRSWHTALQDPAPALRRRAADLAPALAGRAGPAPLVAPLTARLQDPDVTVVVAAAWALGELGVTDGDVVVALGAVVAEHTDALAREAAVAALGALGDPRGLDAVLSACHDRPTVRRRAVLALAPFEGEAVEAALRAALGDRDAQVRQAAEDLLAIGPDGPTDRSAAGPEGD